MSKVQKPEGKTVVYNQCSQWKHNCSQVKEQLSLSERVFQCECGLVKDRDWNASLNIRNEGLRLLV
ncbi:hypothetical protein C0971_18150 (plasmid) [Bacillus methanolicus]|nr:hypothetical protein C0971_18150 [Bacillus methanolicus]